MMRGQRIREGSRRRRSVLAGCTLLGVALAAGQLFAQDEEPSPAPIAGAGAREADDELRPGVLPADATPAARSAWAVLCEATLAPEPIRAFDMSFHLRSRGDEPHDVDTRIRFLSPGYVRSSVRETGRGHLRGDRGDWLIDGEREVRLLGRDGAEDIRQIEETVAVARNFIALTDPRSVRLAGLSVLDGPPPELPAGLGERGARLSWLSLTSPDLHLGVRRPTPEPPGPKPLYRALIGSDPRSGHIELAIVAEAGTPRRLESTTLLLELRGHFERDGFAVPREVMIYGVHAQARPLRFASVPRLQLWVDDAGLDLRAPLTPADFRPASALERNGDGR
ncbi:MAG: hypothetical protein QF903_01070 [Planctomycetota bacterium]|nr:hypothetical protein [Planctomycetota bacterium]